MPATALYMAGPAYSGSSLLGAALNAHSRITVVGEVLANLGNQEGFSAPNCWFCLCRKQPCPMWTPALVQSILGAEPSDALRRVSEVADNDVVVESSKEVRWLWSLARVDAPADADLRVLLVVRSPFAFVDSARREERFETWMAANVWRDTIADALRTVNSLQLPSLIVRYEDFALDPEPTLLKVCRFAGQDFDPAMLKFWDHPLHAIGGNPGAYAWYPGFSDWFSNQLNAVANGHYDEASSYMRHWLHAYASERGVDQAGLSAAGYEATVPAYAARLFGGWVDDKWRDRLDPADLQMILRTPQLADLASLVGYDLANLLCS
jgi:hypothetical protein